MVLAMLICGLVCKDPVPLTVRADASPEAKAHTHFVLVPGDKNIRPTNALYLSVARAVARGLTANGFEEAKSADDADLVVVVDWMVGDPKLTMHHAGGDAGAPQVSGAAAGGKGGMPAGGSTNHAAFGFGMEGGERSDYSWMRTYLVSGVDRAAFKADPKAKPLWALTIDSEGDTDDVAKAAPAVMAGAMPYAGQSTAPKGVHFRMSAQEDSVKYVRGDIQAPVKK
jgi:hypothetical protein